MTLQLEGVVIDPADEKGSANIPLEEIEAKPW